ncbi:MAG: NAD(P)-dependent oxidoreductase, partial [Candidatus Lokiarchaeota archaeon]|nr:NAD(P)-dependent oxidoreductase [Candidatus Lokiarchaeota archaeon]
MDKILISGANGFLGSHLTDYCIQQGKKVYGIDLPDRPLKNLSHYTQGKLLFSSDEKIKMFD